MIHRWMPNVCLATSEGPGKSKKASDPIQRRTELFPETSTFAGKYNGKGLLPNFLSVFGTSKHSSIIKQIVF
jgi:hypothetical protein